MQTEKDNRMTIETTHHINRRIIRKKEVARQIGVTTITIDRWCAKGSFPRPLQLGINSVGWFTTDLDNWFSERTADRDGAQ